jgi:hypothetical protein
VTLTVADLADLAAAGASTRELAAKVGHHHSWVVRKLGIHAAACPELREAWAAGVLSDRKAGALAKLPHVMQREAIAQLGARRKPGKQRPTIDMIREVERDLEQRWPPGVRPSIADPYLGGVLDALRWVTGQKTSPEFPKLIDPPTATTGDD